MADNDQVMPDNAGTKENSQRRNVVKSTKAQQNVSIKNPKPPQIEMRDKDGRQFSLDEANGLVSKFKKQLSISTLEIPGLGGGMQQLTKYIKKQDPDNTSGAVKPALDILDKLLKQGNQSPMASIPGVLGGLMGQLQSVLNAINQANKKHNQPQPQPVCPKGQKWDANTATCVLDPTQSSDDNFLNN